MKRYIHALAAFATAGFIASGAAGQSDLDDKCTAIPSRSERADRFLRVTTLSGVSRLQSGAIGEAFNYLVVLYAEESKMSWVWSANGENGLNERLNNLDIREAQPVTYMDLPAVCRVQPR